MPAQRMNDGDLFGRLVGLVYETDPEARHLMESLNDRCRVLLSEGKDPSEDPKIMALFLAVKETLRDKFPEPLRYVH